MRADAPISCARAQALLESYLDGELPARRLRRFETHLGACAACREELAMARRVQAGLHDLPRWPCPETVRARVLQQTAAGGRQRLWAALWRPALATAGTVATALLIAMLARHSAAPAPYPAELVRAEREARWALAYVAQVTQRASDQALEGVVGEVVNTVIGEQVVVPVTQAVQRPLEEERRP